MKRIVTILASAIVCFTAAAGNAKYVNMFMGTAGDHGQVSAAAQVPSAWPAYVPTAS